MLFLPGFRAKRRPVVGLVTIAAARQDLGTGPGDRTVKVITRRDGGSDANVGSGGNGSTGVTDWTGSDRVRELDPIGKVAIGGPGASQPERIRPVGAAPVHPGPRPGPGGSGRLDRVCGKEGGREVRWQTAVLGPAARQPPPGGQIRFSTMERSSDEGASMGGAAVMGGASARRGKEPRCRTARHHLNARPKCRPALFGMAPPCKQRVAVVPGPDRWLRPFRRPRRVRRRRVRPR